jgi:hypothetical protein
MPELLDFVVKNKVDIFSFGTYFLTSEEKDIVIEPLEY